MKLPSWPILIGVAAAVVVGVIVSIMLRLGSFKTVEIERKQAGERFVVLSRDHLGAYHKIAAVISEVETWARAHGEACAVTFGEYMDNPESTDEDRLRSRGGCVLTDANKTEELKKLIAGGEPDTKSAEGKAAGAASSAPAAPASTERGLSISTIEIGDAVVATFEGSPSIGPLKVYPRAQELMKEIDLRSSGPVVELYEVVSQTQGRTRYLFPVESSRK